MNKEELIEELSIAITHSEQGFYEKNEKYVRDLIEPFISKIRKESIEFERDRK